MSEEHLYRLFPGKAALFRELVSVYAPLQPVREVLSAMGDRPPAEVMPTVRRA